MNRDTLEEALGQVDQKYIASAAHIKKKNRRPLWFGALAAMLAVAVLIGVLWPFGSDGPAIGTTPPLVMTPTEPLPALAPYLAAAPQYPVLCKYPTDYTDDNGHTKWNQDQKALRDHPKGYADTLTPYFGSFVSQLVSGSEGKNVACSPLNVYMALAMLAETTGGESREQILGLLGANTIEGLRTQAGQVWRAHYNDDGLSTSILGSSLWLRDDYDYNENTADLLADNYYASVFRGPLGTEEMDGVLKAWLSQQTGGLLEEQIQDVSFSPETALALATTLYYQVQWLDRFSAEDTTDSVFHAPSGEATLPFMNKRMLFTPYFWSEHFGATYLDLEGSSRMWLFLPDEGTTPEQIVSEAMDFLAKDPAASENQKSMIINLSIPKFDISSDLNLIGVLEELGITDIFSPETADFTPIIPVDDGGYVNKVQHAARVAVNEDGVTAAAFTYIAYCGAAMPPDDEIDFTLDRPFFFVIESRDRLPLFTGIVNEP